MYRNLALRFALLRELSKSGIVALVLISVLGGYLIGQSPQSSLSGSRLLITLLGILFLASGSSALNQYQERHIDAQMPRTSNRPLPSGRMGTRLVLTFIAVTILLGLTLLAQLGTELVVLGVLAVIFYNGLYTLWWKKHWAFAAVPGAIPGALPIYMGYVAATGRLAEPAGIFLFFTLFFWQMPHFWVLALRYKEDYAQGGIPTLPVARGAGVTVSQIVSWCLAYVGLMLVAPYFLGVKTLYLVVALIVSAKVLWELRAFARAPESRSWLHFFLWVNFSLILYLAAAALDLWRFQLLAWVGV